MQLTEQQIEMISKAAASAAIEHIEKEKENIEKRERNRRLRNTKVLLRNYNAFKKYAEQHEDKFEAAGGQLVLNGEDLVESIRQTTERTLAMIRYLDNALETLRYICEQERSDQYEVLRMRFMERKTILEIAELNNVNERTVYKQIDTAAERLSVMLFGVYGLKII